MRREKCKPTPYLYTLPVPFQKEVYLHTHPPRHAQKELYHLTRKYTFTLILLNMRRGKPTPYLYTLPVPSQTEVYLNNLTANAQMEV